MLSREHGIIPPPLLDVAKNAKLEVTDRIIVHLYRNKLPITHFFQHCIAWNCIVCVQNGKARTFDMGGYATTQQFSADVTKNLGPVY